MGPSKQLKQIIQIERNKVWSQLARRKPVGYLQQWSRTWSHGHCETNPASGQSGTWAGPPNCVNCESDALTTRPRCLLLTSMWKVSLCNQFNCNWNNILALRAC